MSQQKDIKGEGQKKSVENAQDIGDDDIRIVEKVVNKRFQGTVPEYRVKWLGYPNSANTWVPAEDLDCPELIKQYLTRYKKPAKKPDESVEALAQGENIGDQSPETAAKEDLSKKPSKGTKRSIQSVRSALSPSQPVSKNNKTTSAAKKNDGADAFYEVESIIGKKMVNGSAHYEVKWKAFAEPSWEPASNLKYCDLLDQYEEGLKKKPASKQAPSTKTVLPPRRLSEGASAYQSRESSDGVRFQESLTGKSDTEIFGQLVVRKLNGMSPFDIGQAQVEILQIINKVKFSVSE
uniref:Chromo domain-containing protein n=1 Tax=Ditylenchus dipsaci TaxID=166011 RepID=A0A915DCU0_9BILA